jgi:O-methyltransferase domain/Dimerisation domain
MAERPDAGAPAHVRMMGMLSAYWTSMALHVAAKLRLADLIREGPRTAEELAARAGAHAPSLYRLLRALASNGVFAEDDRGRFAMTELAECLRSDVPTSQHAMALMLGEEHYLAWAELEHCIRTGETGFDRRFGKPVFDYMSERPEVARTFDAAMVSVHGPESAAMCDVYDFGAFGTLVDVGGGNGSLLIEVLRRAPGLTGVLYDLPHVVERAKVNLQAAGVADRCRAVGGSFFEGVPPGGDAYLLRHIIHDWDDERSLTILRHVRRAVGEAGRLLVVEGVVPPGNGPSFTKMLDLNMLVIPGGKERTEAEYRELYEKAGFRLTRVVPTRAEVSVIEGAPV